MQKVSETVTYVSAELPQPDQVLPTTNSEDDKSCMDIERSICDPELPKQETTASFDHLKYDILNF